MILSVCDFGGFGGFKIGDLCFGGDKVQDRFQLLQGILLEG